MFLFHKDFLLHFFMFGLVPVLPLALYFAEYMYGMRYLKPEVEIAGRIVLGLVIWLVCITFYSKSRTAH
jgi:hypothetical protein